MKLAVYRLVEGRSDNNPALVVDVTDSSLLNDSVNRVRVQALNGPKRRDGLTSAGQLYGAENRPHATHESILEQYCWPHRQAPGTGSRVPGDGSTVVYITASGLAGCHSAGRWVGGRPSKWLRPDEVHDAGSIGGVREAWRSELRCRVMGTPPHPSRDTVQ